MIMDRHAEGAGTTRDAASDPSHAQNAERLADQLDADQLRRVPAGPVAAADQVDALGRAPCRAQHQQQPDLGDRVGQNAGRVQYRQATRLRRRDVDMLVADRIGRDDLERSGQGADRVAAQLRRRTTRSTPRAHRSAAFTPPGGIASRNALSNASRKSAFTSSGKRPIASTDQRAEFLGHASLYQPTADQCQRRDGHRPRSRSSPRSAAASGRVNRPMILRFTVMNIITTISGAATMPLSTALQIQRLDRVDLDEIDRDAKQCRHRDQSVKGLGFVRQPAETDLPAQRFADGVGGAARQHRHRQEARCRRCRGRTGERRICRRSAAAPPRPATSFECRYDRARAGSPRW